MSIVRAGVRAKRDLFGTKKIRCLLKKYIKQRADVRCVEEGGLLFLEVKGSYLRLIAT